MTSARLAAVSLTWIAGSFVGAYVNTRSGGELRAAAGIGSSLSIGLGLWGLIGALIWAVA